MKKIIAIILSALMLFSLCACAAENGSGNEAAEETVITGGWTRSGSPVVTKEISGLMDKALDGMTGASYIPVAYLGTQTVAGTNHAVLCRTAATVPGAAETWAIVYVYEDPEGNAGVTDISSFDRTTDIAGGDTDGGWQLCDSPVVADNVRAALEKAQEAFAGASYEPVAQLTYQTVAGTNYCVLCSATASVPGAEPTYALVYVYEDLDGGAEITEIVDPEDESEAGEESAEDGPAVQIANPFVDYASLDEAARAAGFELTVPDSIEGYSEKLVQVMDNSMIQVVYLNGDSRLFIRKQAGSEDISGDYNEYPEQCGVEVGEYVVSMKGSGDKIQVATWTHNGYTYAVMSDEALPNAAYIDIISRVA